MTNFMLQIPKYENWRTDREIDTQQYNFRYLMLHSFIYCILTFTFHCTCSCLPIPEAFLILSSRFMLEMLLFFFADLTGAAEVE